MSSRRVSETDRAHFRAIAASSGPLPEDGPPRSLAELFERLERIRNHLGPAARPGLEGEDESELDAHLRVLRLGRGIRRRGAKRA